MSFSSLPDVLVQSIAHSLQTKERLMLARCSRRTRVVAQCAFAWLSADPVSFFLTAGHPPTSPLLRFIPVRLEWRGLVPRAEDVKLVLELADRMHFVSLHIGLYEGLSDEAAAQLFEARGLQRLQSLCCRAHTERMVELGCQLPLLTTLKLDKRLQSNVVLPFASAPCLTDLTVVDSLSTEPSCLAPVFQCTKLRRLAVAAFRWDPFMPFWQEPCVQQLHEVSLRPFEPRSNLLSADTIAAGFACLRSLLVLRLGGTDLDLLLAHVPLIPRLRRLVIQFGYGGASLHCSDAALLSMLHSAPALHVEWLVPQVVESMLQPLVSEVRVKLMLREGLEGKQSRVRLVRDT